MISDRRWWQNWQKMLKHNFKLIISLTCYINRASKCCLPAIAKVLLSLHNFFKCIQKSWVVFFLFFLFLGTIFVFVLYTLYIGVFDTFSSAQILNPNFLSAKDNHNLEGLNNNWKFAIVTQSTCFYLECKHLPLTKVICKNIAVHMFWLSWKLTGNILLCSGFANIHHLVQLLHRFSLVESILNIWKRNCKGGQ